MRVVYETENYKRMVLYESNATRIVFVQDKNNKSMDRIIVIRLGNEYVEPSSVSIYRYEDEDYINHILNLYNLINWYNIYNNIYYSLYINYVYIQAVFYEVKYF